VSTMKKTRSLKNLRFGFRKLDQLPLNPEIVPRQFHCDKRRVLYSSAAVFVAALGDELVTPCHQHEKRYES